MREKGMMDEEMLKKEMRKKRRARGEGERRK
jgi:hypothetical protein